jgi:hypothetical protein
VTRQPPESEIEANQGAVIALAMLQQGCDSELVRIQQQSHNVATIHVLNDVVNAVTRIFGGPRSRG